MCKELWFSFVIQLMFGFMEFSVSLVYLLEARGIATATRRFDWKVI